jgi:hypothetical protein
MKNNRQTYETIPTEQRLVALTGLNRAAFEELCAEFCQHWHAYIARYRVNGQERKRRLATKQTDVLPTDEDKLYFILKYMKTNPLQEDHAHAFGMSQPQANMWIHALLPILQTTLQAMKHAPARVSGAHLDGIVKQYEHVLLDATERPIERPEDATIQRASYSGKKKDRQQRT